MQRAANPGSPAPLTTRYLNASLLVLAATTVFTACGSPAPQELGWQHVSDAPAVDDGTARSATTDSLGDPFVLIADSSELQLLRTDMSDSASRPPNAEVQSAWAMLSSDACDVNLSSLDVAFRRSGGGSTGWLATVESMPGVVLDASPHHAIVRYETKVRVDREPGWSVGEPTPATVDVEVWQDGDKVRMHTRLSADTDRSETSLRLDFVVEGAFDQNPDVIPERRFACSH